MSKDLNRPSICPGDFSLLSEFNKFWLLWAGFYLMTLRFYELPANTSGISHTNNNAGINKQIFMYKFIDGLKSKNRHDKVSQGRYFLLKKGFSKNQGRPILCTK